MQIQQQSQIQTLIHTTFSRIAYLRDLLDDSCFEDQKLGSSIIKNLVRTKQSNDILDLLQGMYEAISKEYLESFEIALYLDKNNNQGIQESYTFDVNYGEEEDIKDREEMIRNFCLCLQKLKPLPPDKYATIKLYYNERVPLDYNPTGFKDGTSHNFTYLNSKMKIESRVKSVVPKEIYLSHCEEGDREGVGKDESKEIGNREVSKKGVSKAIKEECSIKDGGKYGTKSPNKHKEIKKTSAAQEISTQDFIMTRPSQELTQNATQEVTQNATQAMTQNDAPSSARCMCGDPSDTFDMIQCDDCNYWLHTVCCGFYSNNDKRIPKGTYTCPLCKGGPDNDLPLMRNLSLMRKGLSIIYNEGYKSEICFKKRLRISNEDFGLILSRLKKEGFIEKTGTKNRVKIIKNDKIKKKIKDYFKIRRTSIPKEDVKMGYKRG